MCETCLKKSKHMRLPKWMPFGKIKVLAHRFLQGEPVPFFSDNRINVAIEAHMFRIQQKSKEVKYVQAQKERKKVYR